MSITRILAVLALIAAPLAENGNSAAPSFVLPRTFSWKSTVDPESLFWPCYIWWWNGPLEPDVLRRQLADMREHGVRNPYVFPLSRDFRPGDYDMDPDYLTPEFFGRVKLVVDEAERLGMNVWIYDEGAWPAGHALRKRPELASRYLACDANGKWTPQRGGPGDFLDPKTTEAFIATTHQPYADALGPQFGRTLKILLTEDARYGWPDWGRLIPWTVGAEDIFQRWYGYSILDKLDAFRITDPKKLSPEQKKVRVDLSDFWSRRWCNAFLLPKRDWCRKYGVAHGGHLDGSADNTTMGAITGSFGNMMRALRTMDLPGVDAVWREIFPDQKNHHSPKFASSAIHQNGTALAYTELFAIYGSGLTPAQMKWVLDYQYVRGITLCMCSHYPITTRDHSMSGERPRICPVEPLWDFLPDFHRYVARLSYVLACGRPDIEIGLYYPVRDIWATGDPNDPAIRGHDALAQALSQHQCDYDIVDDDVLSDPATRVEDGRLLIGSMRYRTIVVGPTQWMADASKKHLEAFQTAGGQVVRVNDLAQIDAAVAKLVPTVQLDPPSPDIRVLVRRWPGGGAAFLFNEGEKPYTGTASITIDGKVHEIEPATGLVRAINAADSSGKQAIPLKLDGWQSVLLASGPQNGLTTVAPPTAHKIAQSVDLADGWKVRVDRQYVVGGHDFEIHPIENAEFKPAALGRWYKTLGLGEDFSGHVTHRRTVSVPESMRGGRLMLDLGGVEYASRVSIDGREIGHVLWSPWRIELPPLKNPNEFVLEIEVSNTLANELTSQRVREAWAKKPPGWVNQTYHNTALKFEMESRGGGLLGPVRLQLAAP